MNTKKVFVNSFLYTVGNLLLKAFAFLLLPLYTAYLSTEEYGIFNLASSFYLVVSCIVTLGLQYSVIRFFADFKDDKNTVGRMFGTVISFILLVGTIVFILLLILRDYLVIYFFDNIRFFPVVLLSILISIVSGLYVVYQDILKGMQMAGKSIALSFAFFFILLFGNIITIVFLHMGAAGLLWSTFIVYTLMVVRMFWDLRKQSLLDICIDTGILKKLLKYSLPLVPHTLAFNISSYATRIIITSKMSLSMLGLYSMAFNFGIIADVILNSVQSAFQPWFFGKLNENNYGTNKDIAKSTHVLMWLYGILFVLIGVYSQEAVYIMTSKEYNIAWIYIPFVVFSVSIKAPLYFYNNFLYYDKTKTDRILYGTLIGTFFCIAFTWILVPICGIWGAILADVISMAMRMLYTLFVVRNITREVYSFWKLTWLSILPMLFMLVAIVPSYTIFDKEQFSVYNLLYKTIILASYIALTLILHRNNIQPLIIKFKEHGKDTPPIG